MVFTSPLNHGNPDPDDDTVASHYFEQGDILDLLRSETKAIATTMPEYMDQVREEVPDGEGHAPLLLFSYIKLSSPPNSSLAHLPERSPPALLSPASRW